MFDEFFLPVLAERVAVPRRTVDHDPRADLNDEIAAQCNLEQQHDRHNQIKQIPQLAAKAVVVRGGRLVSVASGYHRRVPALGADTAASR